MSAVQHSDQKAGDIASALLAHYRKNARKLPWRAAPGAALPDPYHVWLSEIMLQQTTVAAVIPYFDRFILRWPDFAALAAAPESDVMAAWAGLGYYARARNLVACAGVVASDHHGRIPETEAELLKLPGVGAYTAAAIAAIAFGQPEVVVDGNVERVMARLFAVEVALPAAKADLVRLAAGLTPRDRPGDYAQAVMDLGATVCTPRAPACGVCPWAIGCRAHMLGIAADLPRKQAKAVRPTRVGTLWLARRVDGAMLVERRPGRGLLGGTLGFPGQGWDGVAGQPPVQAVWREAGLVRHAFTHFHLDLTVVVGDVGLDAVPLRGAFLGANLFSPQDLPSLMRKAHDLGFGPAL